MARRVQFSGLVIAGIGFFLTRFTVTLALNQDPLRFYFAGIVPLTLGLGLAAFGVALSVANIEAQVVRTIATWCVVGTVTMLVLVVLTILGSSAGEMPPFATVRSQAYLSTFLIGGSVGGTLTGIYASLNQRQRAELERQADRLEVLNRLLRHEVLNAVTVIRGYAPMVETADDEAVGLIQARSDDIEATIEEVRYLVGSARTPPTSETSIALASPLEASVAAVETDHPGVTIASEAVDDDLTVHGNSRIERVLTHLLETAVYRSAAPDPVIDLSVDPAPGRVRIAVSYEGEPLSASERTLLEHGEIGEYDDPSSGFELNVARLLVERYQGAIETRRQGERTTITVVLPRGGTVVTGHSLLSAGVSGVRPAVPTLLVTLFAALLAGVAYGGVSEALGGSIAGIGVFYGTPSTVVGWITHEFHSVVFGFVFAGLVSLAPTEYQQRVGPHVLIGLAWGMTLWIVAAGIIAPVWLRLLGNPAPIPNLSITLLWAHLLWGLTLGLLTAVGYRRVAPRIARHFPWGHSRLDADGWRHRSVRE